MIGELRHRAAIEAKTLTPDGGGGFSEAWETFALVWAGLEPVSGGERFGPGRLEARVSHRIRIRRLDGVDAGQRVRIGARLFAIRAVLDEGAQAQFLTLLCEEGNLS